jgi:hypothetical protein
MKNQTKPTKCLRCTDYNNCQRDEKDKVGCDYFTTKTKPPIYENTEERIAAPLITDRRISRPDNGRAERLWNGGSWSNFFQE